VINRKFDVVTENLNRPILSYRKSDIGMINATLLLDVGSSCGLQKPQEEPYQADHDGLPEIE